MLRNIPPHYNGICTFIGLCKLSLAETSPVEGFGLINCSADNLIKELASSVPTQNVNWCGEGLASEAKRVG